MKSMKVMKVNSSGEWDFGTSHPDRTAVRTAESARAALPLRVVGREGSQTFPPGHGSG